MTFISLTKHPTVKLTSKCDEQAQRQTYTEMTPMCKLYPGLFLDLSIACTKYMVSKRLKSKQRVCYKNVCSAKGFELDLSAAILKYIVSKEVEFDLSVPIQKRIGSKSTTIHAIHATKDGHGLSNSAHSATLFVSCPPYITHNSIPKEESTRKCTKNISVFLFFNTKRMQTRKTTGNETKGMKDIEVHLEHL